MICFLTELNKEYIHRLHFISTGNNGNKLNKVFPSDDGYWQSLAQQVDVELRAHRHIVPAIAVLPHQPAAPHLTATLKTITPETKGM